MKQESVVKYILRLALTLLLITGVVAAALAGINSLTAPKILHNQQAKTWQAIQKVLPGAIISGEATFTDTTGLVKVVYEASEGYAVEVTPVGFGGAITMLVGVSHEGKVLGVAVVSQTETAGLGAVVAADNQAGEAFRDQFIGLSGAVEKGIMFTDKESGEKTNIAMTTKGSQFSVIADKAGTYVGYAILRNGDACTLITDGEYIHN